MKRNQRLIKQYNDLNEDRRYSSYVCSKNLFHSKESISTNPKEEELFSGLSFEKKDFN